MNSILVIALTVSIVIAALFFAFFLKSSDWVEVKGEMVDFKVKDSYISTSSVSSNNRNLFNYEIEVKYRYTYNGVKYMGDKLVAGLPNVTSDKKIVDQLSIDYAVGQVVSVFVDSKVPSKSSLQTAKSFGWKAFFMLACLLVVAGFFVFGVLYFKKMMLQD